MDSFHTSDKLFSHSLRKKHLKHLAMKNENVSVKKKFFSLGFNKKGTGDSAKEMISPGSGQDKLIADSNSFEVDDFESLNKSAMVVSSPFARMLAPNSEEIASMYIDKEPADVVDTILSYLNSQFTFNKDEHFS